MATTSTTTQKTAATKRPTAATKRSTAAKKAAATRSRNQAAQATKRSTAAKKAAETRAELAKTPVDRVQEYAGKAVLIPVGAALTARDTLLDTVKTVRDDYGTAGKAEQQIRRFERRGITARNRVEREVKKSRTRVERELRRRRTTATRQLMQNRTRVEREVKSFRADLDKQGTQTRKNVALVTARVENALQTGLSAGTQLATELQKRVASVA
jgi:hypothetical protein